jgi:geranylgeranyl diphosphate synthase type II
VAAEPGTGATGARGLRLLPDGELRELLAAHRALLPVPRGLEPGFAAVLADLAASPGSFARGQLAWGILGALGADATAARDAAVALEYLHGASLVFDDLPCMDDAEERRGRPCPHRRHGEATAILGGLALITRAYELLWGVLGTLPADRRTRAAAIIADCLGPSGVLGGQARDLAFATGRGDMAVVEVALGKTVPLVRLALVLPALVGGAGETALAALERLSRAWGLAYQAIDDCKDGLMGREETGKSTRRDGTLGRPNLAAEAGLPGSLARLEGELAAASSALAELPGAGLAWEGLPALQEFLEAEAATLRLRGLQRCA